MKKDFLDDINTENIIHQMENENDLNNKYTFFEEHITRVLNKHAPYRELSTKEKKQALKPWITKGIMTSINIKNSLYKKIKEI